MKSRAKCFLAFIVVFYAIFAFTAQTAFALSSTQMQRINNYDGRFYLPTAAGLGCTATGGDLSAPAPTELNGGTNQEKIWNYMIDRGLSAVTVAGMMGNMQAEVGKALDPWLIEHGGVNNCDRNDFSTGVQRCGWGLIQWTNTDGDTQGRRYKAMTYVAEQFGISAITAIVPERTVENTDRMLLYQLNFLFDEYTDLGWIEELNQETSVGDPDGNIAEASNNPSNGCSQFTSATRTKGFGTALYYHGLKVRSADTDHTRCSSGQDIRNRIRNAVDLMDEFAGANRPSCPTGGNSDWGDIEAVIAQFRNEVGDGSYTAPGDQTYAHCHNGCTILSAWFVSEFTTLTHGGGNGTDVARKLANKNSGAEVSAWPEAPAIFSSRGGYFGSSTGALSGYGHTGVVLRVEGDQATVIHTWAAICETGPRVDTYTIPNDTNKVEFVNLGQFLR